MKVELSDIRRDQFLIGNLRPVRCLENEVLALRLIDVFRDVEVAKAINASRDRGP